MSRFWRSKQLVSLCTEDQQLSISRFATDLEEESSFLFPSATTSQTASEYQHTEINMDTISEITRSIITTSEGITTIITATSQTLTYTTAAASIGSDSCLERQYTSVLINNATLDHYPMLQLSEQSGLFEPVIFEKENISHNINEENEVVISETKKRKKNQLLRLLGKNYTGHKIVKVDESFKLEEVMKTSRKMRDKPCNHHHYSPSQVHC
ncbi:unnamed protein product [Parnassius apollo]|uniref:(apollo) hypothetical protein n=1 Tax=Parnassius apollo TaxID=110799 RepID=A0A8S3XPD4_PARAO|nr:unnamed protein product [Parnassius apollo]